MRLPVIAKASGSAQYMEELCEALRKQGLLIREIMAKFGASKASVYRALREAA